MLIVTLHVAAAEEDQGDLLLACSPEGLREGGTERRKCRDRLRGRPGPTELPVHEQLAGLVGHHPVVELLRGNDEVGLALFSEGDGLLFVFEDRIEVDFFY